MALVSVVFFNLFLNLLLGFGSGTGTIHLEITPSKCISTLERAVRFACMPDSDKFKDLKITSIELSQKDQNRLFSVQKCGIINLGVDSLNKFQATGHIDVDPAKSYLNLTLLNPTSADSSVYLCDIYYLDKTGHFKMETISGNLLVEKMDVDSLEKVLNDRKEEIKTLQEENKNLNKKVTTEFTTLKEENGDLNMKVSTVFTTLKDENENLNKKVTTEFTNLKEENEDLNMKVTTEFTTLKDENENLNKKVSDSTMKIEQLEALVHILDNRTADLASKIGRSLGTILALTKIGNYAQTSEYKSRTYGIFHFLTRDGLDNKYAENFCQIMGGYLAEVNDEEELTFLTEFLENNPFQLEKDHFRIAGRDDIEEGAWYLPRSGEPVTFVKWYDGEPNNVDGDEHCLEIIMKFKAFNDNTCGPSEKPFSFTFICEIPK